MTGLGIEKLNVYPSALSLKIDDLCKARDWDADAVSRDFQVIERSVTPPWEDTVTMAVNAANPMLSAADRASVGLLIVASETGVDSEKPVSSWVHRFLELPSDCRNFEVKHACYGSTVGVQVALAWLASPASRDRSALIINADHSLIGQRQPYEVVMGACSAAVLLSRRPRLIAYAPERTGVYAFDTCDVFRPTPRLETGNGELSLLSYFDGLEGAFANYVERVGEQVDAWTEFDWYVYHMPFAGIAARAHRALLVQSRDGSRAETSEHFERSCAPSVRFAQRLGGTYGASTFVGLVSLLEDSAAAGDRVGIFAYGAGSCAELQSATVLADAREAAREVGLTALLDARRSIDVAEYDAIEAERDAAVMAKDYVPCYDHCDDLFQTNYKGEGLLILEGIHDYYRDYGWS